MKRAIPFFPFLFVFLFVSCQPAEAPTEAPQMFPSLEGTWQLISYKPDGDTTWKKHPPTIIYEKYITPTHFSWVEYNTEKDSLLGTGGGSYSYDSFYRTYTEDIQYFLPAGSNELGQAIPFEVGYEDGKWHHTGYAKEYEFDPESGESIVVDSSRIEEIWERTSALASDSSLMGTWELTSYKQTGDSLFLEYPEFVTYQKLITPTHFSWVQFNSVGDEVMGAGGGTYQATPDGYQEKVVFFYPSGSVVRGQTIDFTNTVEDGSWHLEGYLEDSAKIDEFWRRYGPNM